MICRYLHVKSVWKVSRRFIRTFVLHSPLLAIRYARFRRVIYDKKWNVAINEIGPISEMAIKHKDTRILKEMSVACARLADWQASNLLAMENYNISKSAKDTDWAGEDISDATLWISFKQTHKQGIAAGFSAVGYVVEACKLAKYCVLVVDKRLVAIYQRTLPNVTIYAAPKGAAAISNTRLVTANVLLLNYYLGCSESKRNKYFSPFIPDYKIVDSFAEKYRTRGGLPLYGIVWSPFANCERLKAPFELWEGIVHHVPAVFVVIQYRYTDERFEEIEEEIHRLRMAAPGRVIVDHSVDSRKSMDIFAAQLTALNGVVGINCSDVSFAAALDIPVFVVCDDLFRRMCPVIGTKDGWYPKYHVYGKNGLPWRSAFDRLKRDLIESVSSNP